MGTALALLISRAAGDVQLWSRDSGQAAELIRTRTNDRHLPGVILPEAIRVTSSAAAAGDGADLIVAAIPTSYLRATLESLAPELHSDTPVLSVVKGIEYGSFARPSQIIEQSLGPRPIAVLSGPSHAEELARGLPASVVVSGNVESLSIQVRDLLSHEAFRVYTSTDPLGVELAGALKNILGVAAGICDGLGIGDNGKAALLTRGLVEIARFGVHLGARPETFYGLAGVGDVVTTCYSPYGRNRSVGERVGQGEVLDQVLASMVNVAEGVPTARSVHYLARERGVEMPITTELYQVLFEGKSPKSAVADLMVRAPKVESWW
jgi:glycerol-3-phosphate dehydrogenase (NAD(P)+)